MIQFLEKGRDPLVRLTYLLFSSLTCITVLLPEDWQRIILDEQERLAENGCSEFQILVEVWHLILTFFGIGIRSLPSLLVETIQTIDPAFVSRSLHKIYNTETIQKLEDQFCKDYYNRSIGIVRASLVMTLFLYGSFAFLDPYCLSEVSSIWLIRLCVCGIVIFIFYQSFQANFINSYQCWVSFLGIIEGIGIILMIVLSRQDDLAYMTYYSGLMLVYMAIYSIYRIRFFNAVAIGIAILLIYNALILNPTMLFEQMDQKSWVLMINNNFFLIGANLLGALCCHAYERSARLDFLMRYIVSDCLLEIYRYYEHTSPSPQELLAKITKIRHSSRELEKFLMESLIETKPKPYPFLGDPP